MSDGPWDDDAPARLAAWDPASATSPAQVTDVPATGGRPPTLVAVAGVAIGAARIWLKPEATRRQSGANRAAGASRDELPLMLEGDSRMSVHGLSLGAPILPEEAKEADLPPPAQNGRPTPVCNALRAVGQRATAWDAFHALDPAWTDAVMAAGVGLCQGGVLPAEGGGLRSIAFGASSTPIDAPGTRRHIRKALRAGARAEEILCVLEPCVALGALALKAGNPILGDELAGQP